MRRRRAVAQYEATMVLVVVSLSLASVAYAGLRRELSLEPRPVFVNSETAVGGDPPIERLQVNSSGATVVASVGVDSADSAHGVLSFDGSGYSTSDALCRAGTTTFFSVFARQAGVIEVATDGRAWVSGSWGSDVSVSGGWHEVMVQGGSTCSVTLPGGAQVPPSWDASSPVLSSIPIEGARNGTSFLLYLPVGDGPHSVLLVTGGGFDQLEA
jgi:hypothetical protein